MYHLSTFNDLSRHLLQHSKLDLKKIFMVFNKHTQVCPSTYEFCDSENTHWVLWLKETTSKTPAHRHLRQTTMIHAIYSRHKINDAWCPVVLRSVGKGSTEHRRMVGTPAQRGLPCFWQLKASFPENQSTFSSISQPCPLPPCVCSPGSRAPSLQAYPSTRVPTQVPRLADSQGRLCRLPLISNVMALKTTVLM